MAVIANLRNVLGSDFASLSPPSLKKLEEKFSTYEDHIKALKAELTDSKESSEKNAFQLNNELLESKAKLKDESEASQQFKSRVKSLEDQLSKLQKETLDLQKSHGECTSQILQLQNTVKQLSQEKLSMAEILGKKDEEIRSLEDSAKSTCSHLAAANVAKSEAVIKAQNLEIETDNLRHQNNRLMQEKDLLNEQITSLNRDLSEKATEILRLTKDKSSRVLDLQSELDHKVQELEFAQSQLKDLRQAMKSRDKRVDALELKVKDVLEEQGKSEEQFTAEINALTQLANLHKTTAEEAQSRVIDLKKSVDEIHATCRAAVQGREEAELALKEAQSAFEDKTKEMDDVIEDLKKQLRNAEQKLTKMTVVTEEALEEMFPEAASSNRLLRKGMSLTEMYTTYRRSEEELLTKTQENEDLRQQLKTMHEELDEREPIIQVRMQELKKATETIALMHDQMHNTSQYIDKLETERDDAVRLLGYHKREHGRMAQTAEDLSTQVQFLLKEVEMAAGRRVLDSSSDEQKLFSTSRTSTDEVISEHLVTFKNLQELQEQNQKLLAVTRELGQQLEDKELELTQEKSSKLQEQLENVMKELEELREERKVQKNIVESIIQQRDSLRVALLHSSNASTLEHGRLHTSMLSPSSGSKEPMLQESVLEYERAALQKAELALQELKEEFNTYKKEAKTNATMLQEENSKLRDNLTELRLQMGKTNSMLDFTRDCLEQNRTNLEMERKEQKILRENCQKYSGTILQHQQTISLLHKELYTVQEKLSHSEVTIQNLKTERDQLKATEVRLLQDREAAKSQHNSQSKVMAHLQAVQNNLERLESENQVKLTNQIKSLKEEVCSLRSQLDKTHEDYVSAVKAWECKLQSLQEKLTEEQEKGIKSREELVDSYANMHSTKMELSETQTKLKAAEERISKAEGAEGAGARGMNMLRQQLNSAKKEVQNLQQKLHHVQQNATHFSTMVDELNKQLKEAKETSASSVQKLEALLAEKTIHNKNLLTQITEMSEQQNILSEELFKTNNEKDEQIQTLKLELDKIKHSSQAYQQQEALLQKMERQLREEREEQNTLLKEAQEKYQRELVLHAADSEALVEARNVVSQLESNLASMEEKCKHHEEMIEELQSAWGQQEEAFKQESQELKQKAIDASGQCNALHQQLELMSSQLSTLKSTPDWSLVGGGGDTGTQHEVATEHLQEVIRYLRKDKEIAVTQCSASQAETKRLQIKLEVLEKNLKGVQEELSEERRHNQSRVASEIEHSDILKKLEMMNLLHESNRCLRDEKESLSKANADLKEKLLSQQSEILHLNKNSQELLAQVETLTAENSAVRGEIKKWQARAAALTEQSRRHDPQDFRRMEEENASLKEELGRLRDEVSKFLSEVEKQTASVNELRTELLSSRKAAEVAASKEAAAQKEMEKLKAESAENNKTTIQVKKIARKYKLQYDELKVKYDELEASTAASQEAQEASSAVHTAALEQLRSEMSQQADARVKEAQDKTSAEVTKLKEDLEKATKSEEQIKTQMAEKEERTRKVILQAKKKLEILQGEKDNALKSSAELTKEVKDLKTRLSALETVQEENNRLIAQQSNLEARISLLDKEVKRQRETKDRLEKQLEEMAQRKQVTRPSTSGVPVERASSTIQEPLTANIRPMTPPVVTSGSGVVGLRHTTHPTPASARTTPTASIRPMAIGTSSSSSASSVVATSSSSASSTSVSPASCSVASSSTGGHTTRMAAVTPTTANISSTEGEPVLMSTAHVLPTSSGVPQATVQPTPAIPAVVTPLAPPTPPPSSMTEQASSSSADAGQDDQRISHLTGGDDDLCVASSSTPVVPAVMASSVASTSPQTQVVAPTMKRQREEEAASLISRDPDSQPDTTGSSAPQLKRMRHTGDAQGQQQPSQPTQQPLLMERASVVTSGGGVLSSLPSQLERASSTILTVVSDQMTSTVREEASLGVPQSGPTSTVAAVTRQPEEIPPERPGVIVTPEPQPIVIADSAPSGSATASTSSQSQQHQVPHEVHQHDVAPQETQQVPTEETAPTPSDGTHYSQEAESTGDKESESTVPVDDPQESSKGFDEEGEDFEDEEGDPEEEVEEEDEEEMEEEEGYDKMQEENFSQDEDDMGDEEIGSPIHADGEDIAEPNSEEQIITDEPDVEEEVEESQMDAQDGSRVPGDPVLVASSPSSSCAHVPSSVDVPTSSVRTEPVTEGALRTGTPNFLQQQPPHRPPVLPRVQPRTERLPSHTPGFEEGDDSIVPSTPTLSVPLRGDGFAEAVSSPHIPPGRFLFTSPAEANPAQGFSQLASQGALGVDDTRMDLSQFDDGSGRSVPTTPLQVSPPADATGVDLPELLLHPQQSSAPHTTVLPSSSSTNLTCVQQQISTAITVTEPVSSTQSIPTITVTGHEEPEEVSQSSNSSSTGSGVQDAQPIIEEPQGPEEGQDLSPAAPTESLTITEVATATEERVESEKDMDSASSNTEDSVEHPSTSSAQGTGRRVTRKPIVWKTNDGNRIGRGAPFSSPSARGGPRGMARVFRAGRPPGSGPLGRGTWTPRGWRPGGGPPPNQ